MNAVLGAVDPTPSEPPSISTICPNAHTARLPSRTMPGEIASAVVTIEQVAPMLPVGVAWQGTVTPSGTSATVAESPSVGPLAVSVMRSGREARSSPV